MSKTHWLNRTLVLGPHLALCLSEREYEKASRSMGIDHRGSQWCGAEGSARCHLAFGREKPVALVCLNVSPDESETAISGLIAHESVHIWQDWCRSMGEEDPGDEIEAYAVQNLVVLLMDEWCRRTRGH